MGHHSDHILQGQQGGAFNLRVHILPLCTSSQKLHQRDVIPAGGGELFHIQVSDGNTTACLGWEIKAPDGNLKNFVHTVFRLK